MATRQDVSRGNGGPRMIAWRPCGRPRRGERSAPASMRWARAGPPAPDGARGSMQRLQRAPCCASKCAGAGGSSPQEHTPSGLEGTWRTLTEDVLRHCADKCAELISGADVHTPSRDPASLGVRVVKCGRWGCAAETAGRPLPGERHGTAGLLRLGRPVECRRDLPGQGRGRWLGSDHSAPPPPPFPTALPLQHASASLTFWTTSYKGATEQ